VSFVTAGRASPDVAALGGLVGALVADPAPGVAESGFLSDFLSGFELLLFLGASSSSSALRSFSAEDLESQPVRRVRARTNEAGNERGRIARVSDKSKAKC
jgi:hypothetical protein